MPGASSSLQQKTASHYERHPFDFMTEEDERDIEKTQPKPFVEFVTGYCHHGSRVAEIGCGPGRGTMYLTQRDMNVVAVDISLHSLELARRRAPAAAFLNATNLALPLASNGFDLVVSDGVIHHTPDAHRSFVENVRILKPGGAMYLGVYNRRGYYYFVYNYIGAPLRSLERFWLGRALIYGLVFPLYYAVHRIKSAGKRTLRGSVNFFYDYMMTPRASFHTYEEIEAWGREAGLDLLKYDPSLGNVHVFVFRKKS
ncbi:MAG: class I SAM-dependent methyltransferase [Proteobacteria bacterium]|nr:class I SAM-dependent methyltransferase [Pseudomonadota bacterium]